MILILIRDGLSVECLRIRAGQTPTNPIHAGRWPSNPSGMVPVATHLVGRKRRQVIEKTKQTKNLLDTPRRREHQQTKEQNYGTQQMSKMRRPCWTLRASLAAGRGDGAAPAASAPEKPKCAG